MIRLTIGLIAFYLAGGVVSSQPDPLVQGRAALATGDIATARLSAESLLREQPRNPDGPLLLGLVLQQEGKPDEASQAFDQALALKPESISLLRILTGLCLKNNQNQKAWDYMAKARRLAPNSPSVVAEFAEVSLIEGYVAEAVSASRLLILLDPGNPEFLYLLGRALFQSSKFTLAREALSRFLESEPGQGAARLILGSALYHEGLYVEAEAQLELALTNGADPLETAFYQALVFYAQAEDSRSRTYFEKVLGNAPDHGRAWLGLAKIKLRQDEVEEALADLEKAVRFLPGEPDVYFQKSRVLARLGRRAEATEALERYRELKAEQERRWNISNSLPFTQGKDSR